MALKVNTVHTGLRICIAETDKLDLATGIALSLGYTVIDGALNCSKDFIDNQGEYQGNYEYNAGIGAIWIDANSEAYFKFNKLGGESWISNL